MKESITTSSAPAAIGPYSQGISTGGLVITSGQLPIDPATGTFVPGGIEEHQDDGFPQRYESFCRDERGVQHLFRSSLSGPQRRGGCEIAEGRAGGN